MTLLRLWGQNMSQLGIFDVADHYAGLDVKNYSLLKIDSAVHGKTSVLTLKRSGANRPISANHRRVASHGMRW
jgi:hypothetical protein